MTVGSVWLTRVTVALVVVVEEAVAAGAAATGAVARDAATAAVLGRGVERAARVWRRCVVARAPSPAEA